MSETLIEEDGVRVETRQKGIWVKTDNGQKHLTSVELERIAEDEDLKDEILLG